MNPCKEVVQTLRQNFNYKIANQRKIIQAMSKTLEEIDKYIGTCYTSSDPYQIYKEVTAITEKSRKQVLEIKKEILK